MKTPIVSQTHTFVRGLKDNIRKTWAKMKESTDRTDCHTPSMTRTIKSLDDPPATRVVVVAFDGISPFHLAVPCVVFGDRHPGVEPFDFRVCAIGDQLRTTVGFELSVSRGWER